MIVLDDTQFNKPINDNRAAILTFTSPTCSACKAIKPVLEEFNKNYEHIPVFLVDVEQSPRLAIRYAVRGLPTTILVDTGLELDRITGSFPAKRLDDWLNLLEGAL